VNFLETTEENIYIHARQDGVAFKVYIQPRASKNSISGVFGDALKIRLTAPPVDNAANKLCLKFLAKKLHIPANSIEIISGHTGRNKTLLIKTTKNRNASMITDAIRSLLSA